MANNSDGWHPGLAVVKEQNRVETPYLLSGWLERVWVNSSASLQGLIFSRSRVRGYGQLGSDAG